MKNALKTLSIIEIVLGSLAILGGMGDESFPAVIGGGLFLACGIVALKYIKEQE